MNYRTVTAAIITIGALVAVAASWRGRPGAESLFSVLTVWTLTPYAVFFASWSLSRTRGRVLATLIVSAVATAFAAFVYGDAIFLHPTSALFFLFIFIPLYQLIAAAILLTVLFFTRTRNERSA